MTSLLWGSIDQKCGTVACPANQQSESNQEKKPTNLCAPRENVSAMFDNDTVFLFWLYCRINETFARSRCVICVSRSVHVISMYYVRKGS